METITRQTQVFDVTEDQENPRFFSKAGDGERGGQGRRHSAEGVYDVLDPYAAIIEGTIGSDSIN